MEEVALREGEDAGVPGKHRLEQGCPRAGASDQKVSSQDY